VVGVNLRISIEIRIGTDRRDPVALAAALAAGASGRLQAYEEFRASLNRRLRERRAANQSSEPPRTEACA
jgi:hypothetical protein